MCPSLEANNSAEKLPPASIPPEIQSRDVAVPCPFTRFAIPPTDRSLAMLSSLARSASRFQNRLVQTAVDPFTDRIVCRVTKMSPGRVACVALFTAISRKVVAKKVHATIPKGNMGYDHYTVSSLRGRRLKGKGNGVLGARETPGAPSSLAHGLAP